MQEEKVFFKFIASLKRKGVLVALAAVGMALIFFGASASSQKENADTSQISQSEAYRQSLEQQIKSLCTQVRGAGEVEVMITLASGEKTTVSGTKVTGTEMPRVCGVAIICEGGASPAVQAELSRLVCALLGIGSHRVYIGERSP